MKEKEEKDIDNLLEILDHFSAEVFVNDGEYALSATLYTDIAVDGISFFANGQVTMDVVHYTLDDAQ